MKKNIAEYVNKCLVCQQVKASRHSWTTTTSKHTGVEVREYCYGFHSRLTQNTKGLHGNLGN